MTRVLKAYDDNKLVVIIRAALRMATGCRPETMIGGPPFFCITSTGTIPLVPRLASQSD